MTIRSSLRPALLAFVPVLLLLVAPGGRADEKTVPLGGAAKEGTVRLLAEVVSIDSPRSRFFVRESPKIEKSKDLAIHWDDFTKFMLGGEGIAATAADLSAGDSVKLSYVVVADGRNLARTVWIMKGKPEAATLSPDPTRRRPLGASNLG